MSSTPPVRNDWQVFDDAAVTWWAFFAADRFPTVPIAWQDAALAAGERYEVYRVEEVEWLDYQRDRDGFVGDFLRAHPERVPVVDDVDRYPPGFLFGVWDEVRATTRLSYAAEDGSVAEATVSDLADLCSLAGVQCREHRPPLAITATPEGGPAPSGPGVEILIEVSSNIWLPWNPSGSGGTPLDNRALSRINSARLNDFLREVRRTTEQLGGVWGCYPWHDPHHAQADAAGVHPDVTRPPRA